MAQDLANFGQRGTPPQHLGRQGMAELMRTRGRGDDIRALEGMANDAAACTGAHGADGRAHPQKDPPARVVIPYMGLAGKGSKIEMALTLLANDAKIKRDDRDVGGAAASGT